ncbi:MAG: hypothetical protein WDO73_06875 [Ignavibacteriota bacterium]
MLASRPGDRSQGDAVQAFTLVDRALQPLTEAVDFPGPVLALWTSGGIGAIAVTHDLRTEKYSAYELTVVCAN